MAKKTISKTKVTTRTALLVVTALLGVGALAYSSQKISKPDKCAEYKAELAKINNTWYNQLGLVTAINTAKEKGTICTTNLEVYLAVSKGIAYLASTAKGSTPYYSLKRGNAKQTSWKRYTNPFSVFVGDIIYYRALDSKGKVTKTKTLIVPKEEEPLVARQPLIGDALIPPARLEQLDITRDGKVDCNDLNALDSLVRFGDPVGICKSVNCQVNGGVIGDAPTKDDVKTFLKLLNEQKNTPKCKDPAAMTACGGFVVKAQNPSTGEVIQKDSCSLPYGMNILETGANCQKWKVSADICRAKSMFLLNDEKDKYGCIINARCVPGV